jgi:16S rRNA (cytidine1402-2'-O)-methyltransferase
VATPLGNLQDLSPRGREILDGVDLVLCEDTRHTGHLLSALGIATPRRSLHEHNEAARVPEIVAGLKQGRSYALVSDAGTPLVSDPGYRLLAEARVEGLNVSPIPGPCAPIAALSVAGLPTDRFAFEGFLPAKGAARRARLGELAEEPRTLVFFETGRRIGAALGDFVAIFGPDRPATLARELTKAYESVYRGSLAELGQRVKDDPDAVRGEMVLVVEGAAPGDVAGGPELGRLLRTLLEELPPSQAARLAAKLTGAKRRDVYDMARRLTGGEEGA